MEKLQTSQTFKQFLNDTRKESKVSNLLFKYFHPTSHWGIKTTERHINGETINYLTFRKEGTISYLPKGKPLQLNEDGQWSRDGRQEAKPARAIQQVFSPAALRLFTKRDLEIFSNLYKGRACSLHTIKEAKGREIWEIYQRESMFNSCMLGVSEEVLRVYTDSPNVSLFYVEDNNGRILSRVLCWIDNKGRKLIDRVYGDESFFYMFRDYAREIGAYKKLSDSAGDSDFIAPNGTRTEEEFLIPVNLKNVTRYPYIDTFSFIDTALGLASNCEESEAINIEIECNQTGGNWTDRRGVEVVGRSGRYDTDDCYWSEDRSAYVHCEDAEEIRDYYYYRPDLTLRDAFRTGRRSWVLVEDCDEVECFDADRFNGITRLDEVDTFTMYRDESGRLHDYDEVVEVWTHDNQGGEILGENEN